MKLLIHLEEGNDMLKKDLELSNKTLQSKCNALDKLRLNMIKLYCG